MSPILSVVTIVMFCKVVISIDIVSNKLARLS